MIKRFIRFITNTVKNPERDFSERVFVLFSIISVLAVLVALVGDIIVGENIGEIITLVAIILLV